MRQDGSVPSHPFPLPAAVAVTAAGIAAMLFGSVGLALRSGLGLRAQIALGTLALALPAVAALLLRPGWWPSVRGDRPLGGATVRLSLLLGAALWVGSAGLMEVQSLVVPPTPEYLDAFRAIHQALAPSGPLDALVSVLVIAVLPGLCEELVIRGVFLPSLARSLGGGRSPWLAILASALLFAAIHLDGFRFLFTFVLGVAFGFLRLRTSSLWPSVLAHTSLNSLTFIVAPFVDDPTQPYTPSPALGAACLVAGVAASWPLLRALGRNVDSPLARP
jgi:membrane protease YdiL (CAAX protease family)